MESGGFEPIDISAFWLNKKQSYFSLLKNSLLALFHEVIRHFCNNPSLSETSTLNWTDIDDARFAPKELLSDR